MSKLGIRNTYTKEAIDPRRHICAVEKVAAKIEDPQERKDFIDLANDPRVNLTAFVRACRMEGISIGDRTLKLHRNPEHGCGIKQAKPVGKGA